MISDRASDRWIWLGAALGFFGLCGLWSWQTRHDRQVIEELPKPQRQALYERTLETLRTVCVEPHDATLRDFCQGQADFVVRFPECDDACLALASSRAPRPAR